MSLSLSVVTGQIVRLDPKLVKEGQLGLFKCSEIDVGSGMAGKFLDNDQGNVIPFTSMVEIVDPDKATTELLRFRTNRDKARIKEVVASVNDSQEEFSGTIILHVAFEGSLAKSKALTPTERKLLEGSGPEALIRKKMKEAKILFQSDEYDALESFRSKRRNEFANLGIPFPLGAAMYLIRLTNIPKAEELAARTQTELKTFVETLKAVYPKQITKEATGLDVLYNAGDYKDAEALPTLFKFKTKWMHFGVPDILKQIDEAAWERESKRTAEVWAEAKENGLILLRQSVADMTARLVEAVKPGEDGTKKRFFATTITNLTDFFDVFEDRNLAGDSKLAEQVAKLKDLVSNKKVLDFRDDDKLRAVVAKAGTDISATLQTMVTESGSRKFNFDA